MKCLSCDVILTDFEATRRYSGSGGFVDLCNKCFREIDEDVPTVERTDLYYEDSSEILNDLSDTSENLGGY